MLGLSGIIDPPRPEVRQAIKECREAGIKTVMITGDHVETAKAIAKDLRLLPKSGKIMDGKMLNELSEEELSHVVEDVYVFARVSPEHKLKIVKAYQENGHIVAMTGDGVNDAPAIKQADIGVSMGITGTDVAKEASSLVLVDDNFATIKSAIKEGRNIYENIRKFIRYLLASNVGEILVMLFAIFARPSFTARSDSDFVGQLGDGRIAGNGARHGSAGRRRHEAQAPSSERRGICPQARMEGRFKRIFNRSCHYFSVYHCVPPQSGKLSLCPDDRVCHIGARSAYSRV